MIAVYNDLSEIPFTYIIPIALTSIFVHEIGHASAAKYYGIVSRGIGFGFYLFSPVFFTDITKSWRLPSRKRIVVDLAGIYFELIYICILLIIFLFSQNEAFFIVSFTLFISVLFNLDPFLRSDGYWVVSDGLKIPNLRKQSKQKLILFFKKMIKKGVIDFSKNDIFLVIYAFISYSIIAFIIASIFIWNTDSVIYFPYNLYRFLEQLMSSSVDWSSENLYKVFLPLIFYYFLIKILINIIVKKNKNVKEGR